MRASRWVILSALFALGGAPLWASDWKYSYFKGMDKFRAGDYKAAARYLESALQEKGEDCIDCLREEGMFYTDYLPHYYLGLAYASLKQPEKALENLEKLEKSGLLARGRGLGPAFRLQLELALSNARLSRERAAARTTGDKAQEPRYLNCIREPVVISRFYGITVRMCFDPSAVPCIEAEYDRSAVVMDVETLTVNQGRIPERAVKILKEWASIRRDDLSAAWEDLGHGKRPTVIPLD